MDEPKGNADEATIEEAEVLEETPIETNEEVASLISIQNLINTHIAQVDRAKEELKPLKEMMESYLNSDVAYVELVEKAKVAARDKGKKKKDLLAQPSGRDIADKVKVAQDELKAAREALSYYLGEYQKTTGANEFEGSDGELRQIVLVAKLVRKTDLNR